MDNMKMIVAAIAVLALALALSACEPLPEEAFEEEPLGEQPLGEEPTELPIDVEMAVKEALSLETDIPAEEMEVVSARWTEWPDACLGLGEPDEQCAQVVTPGWQVTVRAGGQDYFVRTDEFGTTVRIE